MRTPRTLTPDDLERCAIWEQIATEGGPYDGRLQSRPGLSIPADPEIETGDFIVRASFTLGDGSILTGYCSPVPVGVLDLRGWFRGLGLIQPAIVVERGHVPFWFVEEPGRHEVLALYDTLARGPEEVFPVEFGAGVELPSDMVASGRLEGFCFPRRPPFLSPFPALNRTLLAARLGHVR